MVSMKQVPMRNIRKLYKKNTKRYGFDYFRWCKTKVTRLAKEIHISASGVLLTSLERLGSRSAFSAKARAHKGAKKDEETL
jgi:hypothetical protein